MSASPVLSVPCLPSCVSLSGGVRLAGLVCALSPFICLPSCVSLSGDVRLSGLVCALSPFICLLSCVSLSGGVRLSGIVCALSPFICLPSCVSLEWWCPPLWSCLCLVSLHLSPWVVVSASPVLSVPCLLSFVSLHPLTPLLTLLVFLCWMVCPPSRGDKLTPLVSPCLPSWSPSGVLLGALNAFLRWPPWC